LKVIPEFPAASIHSLEKTLQFDLIKQLKLMSLTLQVSIFVSDICGCKSDAHEKIILLVCTSYWKLWSGPQRYFIL